MAKKAPAYTPTYSVSSKAMQPCATELEPTSMPSAPLVRYTKEAWDDIEYLVAQAKGEVGWLGLVEYDHDSDIYLITEIFIPKQEVTSVTTEIEAEDMARIVMDLMDQGKDPAALRYWGHSHVNMGVSPSGTDEAQIEEYLDEADWFIRGIYNKRGDSKVDVYDVEQNTIFQCVDDRIQLEPMPEDRMDAIDKLLKDNVTMAKPVYKKGKVTTPPPLRNYGFPNQRIVQQNLFDAAEDKDEDDLGYSDVYETNIHWRN